MFRRRHNTSEKSELDAAFQEEKVNRKINRHASIQFDHFFSVREVTY